MLKLPTGSGLVQLLSGTISFFLLLDCKKSRVMVMLRPLDQKMEDGDGHDGDGDNCDACRSVSLPNPPRLCSARVCVSVAGLPTSVFQHTTSKSDTRKGAEAADQRMATRLRPALLCRQSDSRPSSEASANEKRAAPSKVLV